MIEFDTAYRPGRRTFVYLIITYCWWLIGGAVGSGYLAFKMYFGSWHESSVKFLADHPGWSIDVGMLSQWSALASVALLIIAFLRVLMLYRSYSFYVDDNAFHLSRGLIRVQEITIPYKQISNVHIEQPYHWRLFGLAQLDITISSSRDALRTRKRRDFLIPCIDKSLAKALSHFLIRQAAGEEDADDDDLYDEEDGEDISILH